MTNKITWSSEADIATLRRRAEGLPWHTLAAELKVGRNSVIERARRLGLPALTSLRTNVGKLRAPHNDRQPLSAGHPITWSAITKGTTLDGITYPFPVFL